MSKILIVGAGGHGKSLLDLLKAQGKEAEAVGFLDDTLPSGELVLGIPILGAVDTLSSFLESHEFINGVGKIGRSPDRRRVSELLTESGARLATVISPNAYVSRDALVGGGSAVFHGATINVGSEVGRHCIINSHALIEHDSTIGDHTHISTGALVNGGCVVGEHSFIGSGAILHHNVTLPAESVVPAGTVVTRDWTGPDR